MAIINGRRVTNVPNSGVYGSEILEEMRVPSGRRGVIMSTGSFEQIDPNRHYSKRDLLDIKGKEVKVSDIPDRTKGAGEDLFVGKRTPLSKQIVTEQVFDICEHLYVDEGVDFDEDDANWVVIKGFRLPRNWSHIARLTPLLIIFPTDYPMIPPIGCYMRATIPQAPSGHFYDEAYHAASRAPLEEGWRWYCVYVEQGAWKPARVRRPGDWKHGDNLWTYLTLINEALASPE